MIDQERMSPDIDIAFSHWLSLLPSWRLSSVAPRRWSCARCPSYLAALGLDGMMHEPVHSLFCAVHAIVEDRFAEESAPADFEDDWRMPVRSAYSDDMQLGAMSVIAAHAPRGDLQDELAFSRRRAMLFDCAVAELALRRGTMLEAVLAFVEPTVQRMADELIAEICEQ